MKLVLASQNKKKLKEMQEILADLGIEVVLQSDLGVQVDVEETGSTFAENAWLKARAVYAATGLPAIADDSGLVVDALDGAPGVYSARYGGPGLDDTERYQLLLRQMEEKENRSCRFVCSIACCLADGTELGAEGTCEGVVGTEPKGSGGFGYDPVFYLPALGRSMAELTPEEKHAISHRGRALRQFAEKMEAYTMRAPHVSKNTEEQEKERLMELTSKQRAYLRGLANTMDTILHVGKEGISDAVIRQADTALEARELIKGKVLENAGLTAREVCRELAEKTRSEPVQVIGSKFVLYRKSHKKDVKHIELPAGSGKK